MEASGFDDDANDEDALGVVSRYALFQTLYYYFAWLHFLNIIFPFFPSLFHLLGTTFFKIPIFENGKQRAF